MAKIAIYHMTQKAFRDGLDMAGRKEPIIASMMVIEGVKHNGYGYCGRLKIDTTGQSAETVTDFLLDEAWRLTNNIDTSWTENEEVIYDRGGGQGQRSSMVGDVFWIGYDQAYVVGSFGFIKLSDEAAKLIADQAEPGIAN
jgi:hypothetical protein